MARQNAIILEEQSLRIPQGALTFAGFLHWEESAEFPETGRIDFLGGDIEVDRSPEDLFTHNAVKTAIILALGRLVVEADRGDLFSDRARVRSRFAGLSVEPDVFIVFSSSVAAGKIRLDPAASRKGPDRFVAFEGPPDLVVEIISDASVQKDTRRLPPLYARTGVPELWIVDARGNEIRFSIQSLVDGSYRKIEPDSAGWVRSAQLKQDLRLIRRRADPLPWRYTLENRPS